MKEAGRTETGEAAKKEAIEEMTEEPTETGRVLREETGIEKALKEKSMADLEEKNRICVEKNGAILEKAVKALKKQ